ncbi:MAG: hypothetical protein ACRDWS_14060, partial [Acidimicrobiia bacterium]
VSARAQEARAELLRQQLNEAMAARSSLLPEARHAAVMAMSRIAVSATEVDPGIATEIAAALGSLTLDADPRVAQAAQTELERLVTGPGPSPVVAESPPRKSQARRIWLGWAVAGILAVTATVLSVMLLADRFQPDEVGGITVTSAANAATSTAVTRSSTLPAPLVHSVEVPPDGVWPGQVNWIDTGIRLERGDLVEIVAVGEATHEGTVWSGPDGDPEPGRRRFNLPELPTDNHNAMVGRVGDGDPFLVGDSLTFTADADGVFYLGVNDQGVENNTGQYVASITVTPSVPD